MNLIKDGTVKVVVTSPPYWNLKDYFKQGQIGQESYNTYLKRMRSVWQQCFNKLQDDGSLWVNINIRVSNDKVVLIPRDFIAMCKKIGFYYKGIMVWHKSSGIPTGKKNIVDRHEYILVFSKNQKLALNQQVFFLAIQFLCLLRQHFPTLTCLHLQIMDNMICRSATNINFSVRSI